MSPIDKQSFASTDRPERAEQTPFAAAAAPKQHMFSTTGLLFVFAIIIAEGIVLYMLFHYFVQNTPEEQVKKTDAEQPDFVTLPEIQAILQIGSEGRTSGSFRIVPVFELDGDPALKADTKNLIKTWEPKIIDRIRTEMTKLSYMNARMPEEEDELKIKIKEKIENLVGGKGRIKSVIFTTYSPP